jgi:4-nitrophenyl phosphatase
MMLNSQTTNPATRDLQSLSTYIFDLDGVIWRGSEPVEGAAESVRRLQAAGKRCLYCTNNSKKTQKQFAARLREMGIDCRDEEVITSSVATAMYLAAQFTGPFLVYVIGEEGIITALQRIGARVVPDIEINNETEVDCVVVGIDRKPSRKW